MFLAALTSRGARRRRGTPPSCSPASCARTPCCTRAPSSTSRCASTPTRSVVGHRPGRGPARAHLPQPRRRYGRAAATAAGCSCCRSSPRPGARATSRRPPQHLVHGRHPDRRPRPRRGRRTTRRTRRAPPSRRAGCCTVPPGLAGRLDPGSWSPSSSAGCGRCSTPRPWSSIDEGDGSGAADVARAGARRSAAAAARRPAAHHPTAARRLRLRHSDGAPAGRRGPRRAGRQPGRDGRRVALAARRRPAPPGLDGLPGRDQRAARPVARRRAGRGRRPAGRGAPAGPLVRRAPARPDGPVLRWPRSPTPTRSGCPSCARRSTRTDPGPTASCAPCWPGGWAGA